MNFNSYFNIANDVAYDAADNSVGNTKDMPDCNDNKRGVLERAFIFEDFYPDNEFRIL